MNHSPSAFPARHLLDRYRPVIADWDAFLDANHTPERSTLRLRGGGEQRATTSKALSDQGFCLAPIDGMEEYLQVVDGPRSIAQTLEHWVGSFHIQQVVMGLPAQALAPRPGERVLDLCAAPGGKTVHLADLMEERGPLVAVDPKEKRLRGLMSNVFRLGTSNVLVVACDGRDLPGGALFDAVLVDAPCSAEGNYRRQRGRLPNRTRAFGEYISTLQFELLRRGVEVTRPGGRVVYSTCTFAPEENEAVVARALRELPVELETIPLMTPHATGLPEWGDMRFPPEMDRAWRVYPHHLDSGGMFMARLRVLDSSGGTDPQLFEWSEVPAAFPGEDPEVATRRVDVASVELASRFGMGGQHLPELGWMVRGDTIWAHTVGSWPVPAWQADRPKGWRVVSLGIRGTRSDSSGREVPANQLFQRFGHLLPPERRLHLTREELLTLLGGAGVERPEAPAGPLGIFLEGYPLGRAMMGAGGLRSEIQASHAKRLAALLQEE